MSTGPHLVSTRTYVGVFAALLALTALTTAVAFVDLGVGNTVVALTIAGLKAALVLLVFMHLRWSSRLVRILAAAGLLFFFFLLAFTYADVVSRRQLEGWEPIVPDMASEAATRRDS